MRVQTAVFALSLVVPAVGLGACGSGSTSDMPSGSSTADAGDAMVGGLQSFPPTGNMYVDARRCPACHQTSNPDQDGYMAGTTDPIPGNFGSNIALYGPNLTPDMTTGIGAWADDQIANAIMNGIDDQGERLCPQMQHFPDMQMDELNSIIGYLHSLKPVSHMVTPSKCPPLKP